MADGIVHVEIPVSDLEAGPGFYSKVFGWELTAIPDQDYILFTADGAGASGAFVKPEKIQPGGGPVVYIQVDDINGKLKEIAEAGGTPQTDREEVGDAGWFAMFSDLDGNFMGLWENNPESPVASATEE